MSVELKVFGGALFAKEKALKENPELKNLVLFINASNKSAAEAIIAGKLAEHYPANMGDYFKAKVWEHREGLPSVEPGAFCTDFFETLAVWNAGANEPAVAPQPEADEKEEWEENTAIEELKSVSILDQHSRAACLALFGPVSEITRAQYGQVIDLINDDEGSFTRELTEALIKEPRSLALATERQLQLLAWVRGKAKDTAQWTDIKKLIAQWIDTPLDKRPQAANSTHTISGATLGGGNATDRSPDLVHNLTTLGIEVAVAIMSMYDEIDIYSIPSKFLKSAKGMAEAEQDGQYNAWWEKLRSTPGILDYSRAAIIALIKSAPEDLYLYPVKLREYISKNLVELNHNKPDPKTIEIACSAKPRNIQEKNKNDETQPPVSRETLPPAGSPKSDAELNAEIDRAMADRQISEQLAGEHGEFVPGISDPADPQWVDGSAQPVIESLGDGKFSIEGLMIQENKRPSSENDAPEVNQRPQVVNFSGGRTSAYLVHLMEQRRKAGENIHYVFMDTGAEHPGTYEFIRNVVKTWNIPLVCLRVVVSPKLGEASSYRIVNISEIGPDLQPWRDISSKFGLPYFSGPFCTRAMKTNVFGYYCRNKFGKDGFHSWLGIRADEPKRLKERKDVSYLADISPFEKRDILDWWKAQPFDLGIPEHLGNCVFCIKKGINKLALAARDEPQLAKEFWELAIDPSNRVVESRKYPNKFMYRQAHSLESIIALFSDHSREDIASTIRGGGGYETESCTDGCEIEPDDLEALTHVELSQSSDETLDTTPVQSGSETSLSYRQQLVIAALQGMCANPAYRGDFDDLPTMATMLAEGVINQGGI